MDFSPMTTTGTAIAGIGACLLATEVPLPEPLGAFASLGVTGLSLFLLWWVLAKLIPGMTEAHGQQLRQQGEAHAAAVKSLTDFIASMEYKQ